MPSTLTRIESGIMMIHDHGEPTHVIAYLRRHQRTFRIGDRLQETIDRARAWRGTALSEGVHAADKSISDDVVVRAQKLVKSQSSVDAARADVQRAMARYHTTWDYHGYRNVYGHHVTPSFRITP